MKLVITGGRDYTNRSNVFRVLDLLKPDTLIHGACGWDASDSSTYVVGYLQGADGFADQWAIERRCVLHRCPANWTADGKSAGPIRNRCMLEIYKPDLVVAFDGGPGTANCVKEAKKRGILVWEKP